ncbi:MAG TPA: zinc-dependent peptidase [Smithellaceae bacterium]|nr:zinc-dependent peptidase [Smithellaceae bacterium]
MFQWLTNRRRQKLTDIPFPPAWEKTLQENFAQYVQLNDAERAQLRALISVFIREKHWEGCGGLALNDEIRVTVSAQACLLLLGLPHNYYKNVETIIIYPSTVVSPERKPGYFENILEPIEPASPIIGEAFHQGPLILVWDAVLHGGRRPQSGHNVVYHEFAHKLDMLDGAADGTPPLGNRAEYREWVQTCSREYLRIKKEVRQGQKTFLDDYGAVNEAEFFAVATEQFFVRPLLMLKQTPNLYRVMKKFYRQDPASRGQRKSGPV